MYVLCSTYGRTVTCASERALKSTMRRETTNYARRCSSFTSRASAREVYRLSAEQSDSFTPQKCQLMSLVLVQCLCVFVFCLACACAMVDY